MSTADPPPSVPHVAPNGLYVDVPDPTYPDSDGMPMADGTQQFDWIVTIKEGLEALFADRPDVFVAGDLLWYYTEKVARDCVAPDAMVVFGRPKGMRHSYRQWLEGGLPPRVVFEVRSHSNTAAEMKRKQALYDRLGVEEYYDYDPRTGVLKGWLREEGALRSIAEVDGWRSPCLGVTFEAPPAEDALVIRRPDGTPFVTAALAIRQRDEEARRADEAERRARAEHRLANAAHQRAEKAEDRADRAEAWADAERRKAEAERQKAEAERRKADAERQRAERLAARLRAMGLNPELDSD